MRQISLLHSPSPPAHLGSAGPDAHYTFSAQGDLLWKGVLYVPDHTNLRLLLLQSCHDHHLAGHPGVTKTVQVLRRRYYWPNMSADVYRYVRACASCRRNKTVRHKTYGPLRFLPIPERPWSSISMDFIEWLPVSQGFDTILVVVDRLTKMALFIPTHSNDDVPWLARHFLEHVFSKHGTPSDIVSDRGKHFVSRFWVLLCTLLGIQSNLSTAYHPETDGQTERTNQILEQYLRMYINYEQDDWATLLPYAKFAYNNTPQSATGVSPFFANKGYHLSIEVNVEQVSSSEAAQMTAVSTVVYVTPSPGKASRARPRSGLGNLLRPLPTPQWPCTTSTCFTPKATVIFTILGSCSASTLEFLEKIDLRGLRLARIVS